MDRIKGLLKSNFRIANIVIIAVIAFLLSAVIYKILLPICTYSNLNDFYAGTTIFTDHNKYLDIGIFFIYLAIFLSLYLLIKVDIIKTGIKFDILKYKKIINVFLFLFCSYLVIFFIIYFIVNFYIPTVPDPHHYGEKFAAYYMHKIYGMKYYKDIMLVHGYLDVIPSWIADNILGGLTYKAERTALVILQLTLLVINTIFAFIIFKRKYLAVFISSGLFLYIIGLHNINQITLCTSYIHVGTLMLAYLLLLEKINTKNNFVWNLSFFILCFLGLTYHTTIGTACTIAMLPMLICKFKKTPKFCIIFWSISIIFSWLLFGNSIIEYLHKAQYYVSSNLYVFGNLPYEKFSLLNIYRFVFVTLCLIISPVILILSIITKNIKIRLICIYTIILVFGLLNYSLGRMDSLVIPRLWDVNIIVISVVIPYILYKYKSKNLYLYNILIIFLLYSFSNIYKFRYEIYRNPNISYFRSQIQFINDHTKKDDLILDLNNVGMIYYYSQRKAAIPYTSFYNMVNTKQNEDTLAALIKNPPKCVILINYGYNIYHDRLKIPLKINKIYSWLFNSGLYKLEETNDALYLIYSPDTYPNKIKYTPNLDKIFNENLYRLPDVWGKSVKTLPMKEVQQDLIIKDNIITSDKGIDTNSADLLYIKYSSDEPVNFSMQMDSCNFKVNFNSNNDEILILLNNYPIWYTKEKIKEIRLNTDIPIKITDAKLYKIN